MQDYAQPPHTEQEERLGDVALGVEGLPEPLEHIIAQVFSVYQARTSDELVTLLRQRYREDATFVDPTVAARPRSELALQFYSLQHLFSSVQVSSIGQPEVHLAPQPGGPSLLEVIVRSRQYYKFARSNHISQQILPECTTLDTSSRLLLDRRTGLVVRHEDCWTNKPTFHLPMTWRRVNSVCTHTIWRLLGWGREMAAAEARCDSGGGADSAGPWGDAAAH